MIVMAVGNENVDETLALGRGSDRLQMTLVGRSRIDDGHLSVADNVSIGAEEGVRAGIVGHDAADAGRNLLGHAIIDVNTAIEGKLRRHGLGLLDGLPGNFSLILTERAGGGSAAFQQR
jgi:ABC-type polysaccharide/polyol phosphate transport system ATPase subunit